MTLTILMSFSVLALVVTARPILPNETPQSEPLAPAIQHAVQAIFQSRTKETQGCLDCYDDQDIHVKLTSPEEQHAVLSSLDDIDAVKTIVPIGLDGVLSEDEKKLYDIISTSSSGHLNDLDGGERIPEEFSLLFKADSAEDSSSEPQSNTFSSLGSTKALNPPPLVVLAISCVAVFLAMGCIAVAFYTTCFIRKRVLGHTMTWELLSRLEKQDQLEYSPDDVQGASSDGHRKSTTEERLIVGSMPNENAMSEKADLIVLDSDTSDDDIHDEKFHDGDFFDAEERPLSALDIRPDSLSHIVVDEIHPDPDFLPLPRFSTPLSSPPLSPASRPLQIREISTTPISSPLSKPSWSLRASDAPALGLSSSSPSRSSTPRAIHHRSLSRADTPSLENLAIPGALYPDPPLASDPAMSEVQLPNGRRAYRAPLPELDIAFAMQLRPGLGLGADPAWLVRFLMAMFGWMTVLIGGGNGDSGRQRRATA